jgi:hypothetical protein
MHLLRQDGRDERANSASTRSGKRWRQHYSGTSDGSVALDLVNQAAEVIRDLENRSAETEARAGAIEELARQVVERAEQRIRVAEEQAAATAARAEALGELAEQTIERAKQRISEIETRLQAAEDRAQTAEAQAREAQGALKAVEEAIRTKFLNRQENNSSTWSEAA